MPYNMTALLEFGLLQKIKSNYALFLLPVMIAAVAKAAMAIAKRTVEVLCTPVFGEVAVVLVLVLVVPVVEEPGVTVGVAPATSAIIIVGWVPV